MTLTQLNILKILIETESFTKSAEALYITQSGVSHSIASLEDELEIKLVKTNKRTVSLTEAGEKVYIAAKDILTGIDRLKEEISALKNLRTGNLKIGCFQSVSVRILPGILKEFKRKYPGIEVSWFEGTDLEVTDWLLKGAVDIGFVVLPAEGLETVPLLEDKMFGVFPEKHPICSRKSIGIKELAAEQLITFKGSSCGMLITSNLMRLIKDANEIKHIEARNIGTIVEMIREGIGVAVIPELAIPLNYNGICSVPIRPEIKREIALAAHSFNNLSLSARAFVEITEKFIEKFKAVPSKNSIF
ncbi:MAG: LysR family transcriptional regulator [Candidatus Acididesulfobacter diazotrophicus]|jgi:DNA-binding transcriptional LysR family regulator|uniref:LysR family transcriptional regulator n=1 Tax=Candidatus Acididesulfobacter diazotrophicus TaxID=2597226 RepID=A0A519BM16_9DELT|nr:MAG: LysR family transcriptional regulator [Candidatus Acididesulfobacter diazotrophicus]